MDIRAETMVVCIYMMGLQGLFLFSGKISELELSGFVMQARRGKKSIKLAIEKLKIYGSCDVNK